MNLIEKMLLNTVQTAFPVQKRPFMALGEQLGISESEAYENFQKLKSEGIIRRTGGVFDSRMLGYSSTLCAAQVSESKIAVLADLISKIPGVTHNYLRNHPYNMWFTLIAPSTKKVQTTLESLREKSGVAEIYSLPAVRLFKIKVDFDFVESGTTLTKSVEMSRSTERRTLTLQEIAVVKAVQEDLPPGLTPFAELAKLLDLSEEKLITTLLQFKETGIIRRFGTVLRHQKAGFTANAMGVWQVPPARTIEVGNLMSRFKEVSHCYERPLMPEWSYNIFSMIHGRSLDDCQRTMEKIAKAVNVQKYEMLLSTAELKKSSMKYFTD